jgi:hypothetical protein
MTRILESYIAMMCGADGVDQTVTVEIESFATRSMVDDVEDILHAAQKACAAKLVDYDSFNSDSDYLNALDARAIEFELVSVRKPGKQLRFAYEGYVGENKDKLFNGPVLAVDFDEADFAARWGIALQAGILKGDARLRDPAAFCESLEAVEVTRCDKNPVSLDELADSSRSVIAAHAKGEPISDLLDELAALTALV